MRLGGSVIRRLLGALFLMLALAFSGCTQKVEAPGIYSPNRQMNFEACRNASIDLRNLTAQQVKGLVTCLNGDGQLQPYKDFVDSMSNEDLTSLIQVFDRHVELPKERLDLMLDLAARAREKGYMKHLYASLQNLTETETLQNLAELMGLVYGNFQGTESYKGDIAVLREFTRELIEQRVTDQVAQAGARGFNGVKGKSLAWFLSRTGSTFPLGSDEIVDQGADVLTSMLSTRDLKPLQILSADPAVHRAFGSLTNAELQEIEKLFVRISRGASRGDFKILEGLQKLTAKTDRPMRCFDNGTHVRNFQNLFDTAADEQARRRNNYDRINRFWLVEMPIMLSASISKCDLDRSVVDDIQIASDLARQGLATGLAMSLLGFYDQNRGHYIKGVLKNQHAVQAGGLIENLAVRQGTTYAIELLTRSLKPADYQAIGYVLTGMSITNRKGAELEQWLEARFRDPALSEFKKTLATLTEGQRSTLALLTKLEAAGPNKYAAALRMTLAIDAEL
ncbi:MAG TPA: hypothetical protein VFV50_02585, partial [Bdellovibrionales bacterium]|nr:hypothetical protein [Bdellovibrionales bacterium]